MRDAGRSFYEITKQLNNGGFRTRRNKQFQQVQVQRLYSMAKDKEPEEIFL